MHLPPDVQDGGGPRPVPCSGPQARRAQEVARPRCRAPARSLFSAARAASPTALQPDQQLHQAVVQFPPGSGRCSMALAHHAAAPLRADPARASASPSLLSTERRRFRRARCKASLVGASPRRKLAQIVVSVARGFRHRRRGVAALFGLSQAARGPLRVLPAQVRDARRKTRPRPTADSAGRRVQNKPRASSRFPKLSSSTRPSSRCAWAFPGMSCTFCWPSSR